jgi:hypothetical protein
MSRAQTQAGRAPDGITPLVGYRCWTLLVGPARRALHSLNGQLVRQVNLDDPLGQRADPWLVARCLNTDHDAPEENCGCGFYALKSLSALGRVLPIGTRALRLALRAEPGADALPVAGRVTWPERSSNTTWGTAPSGCGLPNFVHSPEPSRP